MAEAVLSYITHFDDLIRCYKAVIDNNRTCEKLFFRFAEKQEICRLKWVESINECKRLKAALEAANKDISTIDKNLSNARCWLDNERQHRRKAESERDALLKQLANVRKVVLGDSTNHLPDETRQKLSFLNNVLYDNGYGAYDRLGSIAEFDATCSNLSETSYSRSEDDIDEAQFTKPLKKHRPSFHGEEPVSVKRRRSSGPLKKKSREINLEGDHSASKLIATTTVTVQHGGPCSAKSVLESFQTPVSRRNAVPETEKTNGKVNCDAVPKERRNFEPSAPAYETPHSPEPVTIIYPEILKTPGVKAFDRINTREHSFITKTIVMPENCIVCDKKIKFGRSALKCTDCNAIAHQDCHDRIPLPCIPMFTPSKVGTMGYIQDYTSNVPPMIPALVIHCINEVEQRGLTEMGIYRVPGSDKEVRALKERFFRCKGAPDLSMFDIHTICGCLKDFFRTLQDTLIPRSEWDTFLSTIKRGRELFEKQNLLHQAVSGLPQPNRDTLAFLLLHLQNVARSPACKMPIGNLAKVFALSILGSPNNEDCMYTETQQSIEIMEELLNLSTDYWSSLITEPPSTLKTPVRNIYQTPSAESLVKSNKRFLTTPMSRKRFFDTPPSMQKSAKYKH